LSPDVLDDVPTMRWRALLGSQLAVAGLVALIASCLVRRRRVPVLAGGLALVAIGAGVGVLPLVVDAYPTTYKRPLLTYHAASIASGMTIYGEHCSARRRRSCSRWSPMATATSWRPIACSRRDLTPKS